MVHFLVNKTADQDDANDNDDDINSEPILPTMSALPTTTLLGRGHGGDHVVQAAGEGLVGRHFGWPRIGDILLDVLHRIGERAIVLIVKPPFALA